MKTDQKCFLAGNQLKKIRVLLDIGVITAHLGMERVQEDSCKKIMFLCGDGSIEGCMTVQMFCDLHEKLMDRTDETSVKEIFDTLLKFIKVIPLGEKELKEAYIKEPEYLKDVIAAAGAKNTKCSWIIAEPKESYDYDMFGIPVVEPDEFIRIYQKEVRKE